MRRAAVQVVPLLFFAGGVDPDIDAVRYLAASRRDQKVGHNTSSRRGTRVLLVVQ